MENTNLKSSKSLSKKDIMNRAHLKLIRAENGVKIFLVDGKLVRDRLTIEFTMGGHHYRYPFIPKDEIWIDDGVNENEIEATIKHETHEYDLMKNKGIEYSTAHARSSQAEKKFRNKVNNSASNSASNLNLAESLVDELTEDSENDEKIVKSFHSKADLCPDLIDDVRDCKMKGDVRRKLLEIANTFIDFLGVSFFVYDIVLTGSLANYNWSEFSDLDLHIFVDTEEFGREDKNSTVIQSIMKKFFDAKKDNWNELHNIKIKNYDVEIYVQDIYEKHLSSGVYSVLTNKWLIIPVQGKDGISEKEILAKSDEYMTLIDDIVKKSEMGEDVVSQVDDLKDKLKKFRQSGLEEGGEYSYENLTFKLLRRNGYIGKLLNLKKDMIDKKLSITQQ